MKIPALIKTRAVGLAAVFCFGCSSLNPLQKQTSQTSENKAATDNRTSERSSRTLPCVNKFYPVKNGLKRNYGNKIGSKTAMTMEYKDGDAGFTEVTTLKDITVKHVWNCTNEGLVAANYGSAAEMSNMQSEPKHISGVTLPKEDEIKIVSLDDEVKTSAGTFKAVKIEIEIVSDMKLGGKEMPVPKIQSTVWFAPEIGMVKSTGGMRGFSNTMEYTGSN